MHTFVKDERLCGSENTSKLHKKGQHFVALSLRIVYLKSEEEAEDVNKVLISVAKKRFKKAVDRNKFKRLIREAYRLNKGVLEQTEAKYWIGFTAIVNTIPTFQKVDAAVKRALNTIVENDKLQNKG